MEFGTELLGTVYPHPPWSFGTKEEEAVNNNKNLQNPFLSPSWKENTRHWHGEQRQSQAHC